MTKYFLRGKAMKIGIIKVKLLISFMKKGRENYDIF
jgi:hypothetical protein